MTEIYKWRDGARCKVKASIAGKELNRIRIDNGGLLKPKDIVHNSKPKEAPLHNEFEWNNAKAAGLYREEQARYITRVLRVVHEEVKDEKPVETRAFVQIEDEESNRAYVTMAKALSDDELRHQVIYKAHRALITARNEIREINDLIDAVQLIDKALEKVDLVLKKEESKLEERV